jgi:hypothetical protein
MMLAVLFGTVVFAQKYTEFKTSEIPKAATEYIKTNLPGAGIEKAVKSDDNGTITYNVMIDTKGRKHILVFDKNGNFVRKGDDLFKTAKTTTDPKQAEGQKTTTTPAKTTDPKTQETTTPKK